MKMNKLSGIFALSLLILMSCGKPNDPESIVPDDTSGGYKVVTKLATSGFAQDLVKRDTLLYMAQGEGGLLIVNVKDPENPVVVSVTTENVRGYSNKITLRDSVIYIAAGAFGVTVLDVSDPFIPEVTVSNLNMKPAKNIHIMGDYMFTAISELGVKISEISYPTQPDIRGGITMDGYVNGVVTSSDSSYLFAACGEMGLSIYNISDFQQGFGDYFITGWCDTPGYAKSIVLDESRSLAYIASGAAGLQILDYSDTTNIHIVGSFQTGGTAEELILMNQTIFITAQKGGFQVIDVSQTASPQLIGKIETKYALGLEMDEKYIYIADDTEGLIIISFPDGVSYITK